MDLNAEAKADNTRRVRTTAVEEFEAWCAKHGRVARPWTMATYTEYGTYLMSRANRKDGTRSMKGRDDPRLHVAHPHVAAARQAPGPHDVQRHHQGLDGEEPAGQLP
ncbi:hypothetical protein OG936_10820 [Streptomyces sp. NBC_00846]|uniref:hypothetical protein n=1 Tax=Streptomyces sp. NBC_00846 TaxID=2975849 RepID=UPI00386A8E16|nr:hypothetical protein OG936_10820 [Streptomyces sp. NBC_00846]